MKIKYVLALLFIFSLHVASNYWVLSESRVAHIYDESGRIRAGADIYFQMGANAEAGELAKLFFKLDTGQAHPHFFEVVETVSWKLLGGVEEKKIEMMILIASSLFLLILLLSVYGIGSILYDKNIGLLAAFLTPLFPLVFGHSRMAMLDYPLMCMVSLSFFMLLRTRGFSSLLFSGLFGIAFGLSETTKEAALLFVVIPFGYYFIESFLKGKKLQVALNALIAILFFLAVAGAVYFQGVNGHAYGIYLGKIALKRPMPPWYYLSDFHNIVGPMALVFCAPFLVKALMNFKKREAFLFLWFFAPVIIFSCASNKSMRFLLPIAPAFALLIAREVLDNHLPHWFRRTSLLFLMIVTLAQYGLYHGGFFAGLTKSLCYLESGMTFIKNNPYRDAVDALSDCFKKEASVSAGAKNILALFDIGEIVGPLETKIFLERLPFRMQYPLQADAVDAARIFSKINWTEHVSEMDYLLDRQGGSKELWKMLPNQPLAHEDLEKKLKRAFEEHRHAFLKIAQVPVCDGSRIDVYRKIKE